MRSLTTIILIILVSFITCNVSAQDVYSLQNCINYALEHNNNIRKSKLDLQKSMEARREIAGSLLPHLSASGSMNYNIRKPKFVMPNFINDMLPPAAQDPDAVKYLTIEMGTSYTAGLGAALNQQILNFALFNTFEIARTAENMASLGVEQQEEEIIAQTAGLYYSLQSSIYAAEQFGQSLDLIDKMLITMEANYLNGLVKKVDLDRLKVNRVNLATRHSAIINAIDIQKKLLKLQMGMDTDQHMEIEPVNLLMFEQKAELEIPGNFDQRRLIPFQLIQQQQKIGQLQVRSVKSELLPSLVLGVNYQYNLLTDDLFNSESQYTYPSSVVGLNLRLPIFAGMSQNARLKSARIELMKLKEDEKLLEQSLNMAYMNALLQLDDSRRTIDAQRQNMKLAGEVFRITQENYMQGLDSLSDVLNANSSLIQSQISYAEALNSYMRGYIELRKANGTIRELVK